MNFNKNKKAMLYKSVDKIPNSETIEAINEAYSDKELESIDDLTSWLE